MKSHWNRILASLLAIVMVLGSVPLMSVFNWSFKVGAWLDKTQIDNTVLSISDPADRLATVAEIEVTDNGMYSFSQIKTDSGYPVACYMVNRSEFMLCDRFVYSCAIVAALGDCIPQKAGVKDLMNAIIDKGGYVVSEDQVKRGDICVWYCTNCTNAQHIGIVTKRLQNGNVETVEGNGHLGKFVKRQGKNYNDGSHDEQSGVERIYIRPNYPSQCKFAPTTVEDYGPKKATTVCQKGKNKVPLRAHPDGYDNCGTVDVDPDTPLIINARCINTPGNLWYRVQKADPDNENRIDPKDRTMYWVYCERVKKIRDLPVPVADNTNAFIFTPNGEPKVFPVGAKAFGVYFYNSIKNTYRKYVTDVGVELQVRVLGVDFPFKTHVFHANTKNLTYTSFDSYKEGGFLLPAGKTFRCRMYALSGGEKYYSEYTTFETPSVTPPKPILALQNIINRLRGSTGGGRKAPAKAPDAMQVVVTPVSASEPENIGSSSVSLTSTECSVHDGVIVSWGATENTDYYTVRINGVEQSEKVTGTQYMLAFDHAGAYEVCVCGNNEFGAGEWSDPASVTVHADVDINFYVDGLLYQQNKCAWNCTFYDYPAHPYKEGHTFTGWYVHGTKRLASFDKVTQELNVDAGFQPKEFTVRFIGHEGALIAEQHVLYGKAASEPDMTQFTPSGYDFVGWNKDISCIKDNMTVTGAFVWKDKTLPITINTANVERGTQGYTTYCTIQNHLATTVTGRVVVALKTYSGKLIATTESDAFSLGGEDSTNGGKKSFEIFTPYVQEQNPNTGEKRILTALAYSAEVYCIDRYQTTVPISPMLLTYSITEISSESLWSKYFEGTPSSAQIAQWGDGNYQTYTEYSYRNKEYNKGTSSSYISGWNMYNTNSYWGSTQSSSSAVTATSTREVWTDTTTSSTTTTTYNYKRYVYYYKEKGQWYKSYSSVWANSKGYTGSWEYKSTSSELAIVTYDDGVPRYEGFWYRADRNQGGVVKTYKEVNTSYTSTTIWYYRDKYYTYDHWRWGSWSNWSTTPVSGSGEREVRTRSFYRYKMESLPTDMVEDNSGERRLITSKHGEWPHFADYAGLQATLFIYKYNEASDWTTEYLGQTVLDADGDYTFLFKLREEPSTETGDYTVAMGIQGADNIFVIGKIEAPVPEYTVNFYDDDDTLLSTQTVRKNEAAIAPTCPQKEGYTFVGWSDTANHVTADIDIHAQYIVNTYFVAFVDWQGETLDVQSYTYGQPIEYPELTDTEEMLALGWDRQLNADEDTLSVQYNYKRYAFADAQGNLIYSYTTADADAQGLDGTWEYLTTETELEATETINGIQCFENGYFRVDCNEEGTRTDQTEYKVYSDVVTDNLVITAVYEPKVFSVTYYAPNTESITEAYDAIDVQTVPYGETATIPDTDFGEEVLFQGWQCMELDEEDYFALTTPVTQDLKIYPKYTFKETTQIPTADVQTGEYAETQTVTLSCATEDAVIYYTTDDAETGSDSETESVVEYTEYTEPLVLAQNTVLKFMACSMGRNDSDVVTEYYAVGGDHLVGIKIEDSYAFHFAQDGALFDTDWIPQTDGHTFVSASREGSDTPWNMENDRIIAQTYFTLQYDAQPCSVLFLDYDDTVLSEQTVDYGASATQPGAPVRDGYVFTGWNSEDWRCVRGDTEIYAQYVLEDDYVRVTLDRETAYLYTDTSVQLHATLSGRQTDSQIEWYSEDDSIAVVDETGKVTGMSPGTVYIYAEVLSTGETDACEVQVIGSPDKYFLLCVDADVVIADGYLREVKTGSNTVAALREQFQNSNVIFVDQQGKALDDDALVGTGVKVQLVSRRTVQREITVVMTGDMDGDGQIGNRDAAMIARYLVDKEEADLAQMLAIDVNGDGYVNNRDASMVARYLVGKETI